MSMSFEEKSVWIQLAAMVTVMGGYFFLAGRLLYAGIDVLWAYAGLLIPTVILMVIILAVGHAAAALLRRPEPADERDRLIGWRAEASASWVVAAGAFIAIGCMLAELSNVWVANVLLLSMFLSEVLKYALQIVFYRRGI